MPEEDELPVNCPKCGKFMKYAHWIGESSNECESFDCVCGYGEIYQ